MLFSLTIPYSQNLRYMSILYAPFYLIGGLGLWYLFLFVKSILSNVSFQLASVISIVVIILSAMHDYQSFEKIFVRTGALDVSIRMVREYSH